MEPLQGGPCNVGSPPTPAGEPDFLWRKSGERTPVRREVLSALDPPLSGWWPGGGFFYVPRLACGPASHARNGPPPSWAGWGGWFRRREGSFPRPKPSPWGEGAPVRTLGRMRGRPCTQPFLVEIKKRAPACRPNGIFLLLRWASRSPPHQSPSVTASPQVNSE